MARREIMELTTLCLLYRGNEVLLQDRVKEDWRGFALPGGHVEPGESIVESVVREMREETGLTVLHPQLCGVKQFPTDEGRYLVILFKSDEFTGDLVSSEEGRMEWVHLDQLEEYDTVADLKELLDVMLRDDLTEFQYIIEDGNWIAKLY
jgi:8-oxo-dGTP diphosphatase